VNLSIMHAFHLDQDPHAYRHKPPIDPSSPWWHNMPQVTARIGRVLEANQGPPDLRTAVLQPQRAAERAQPVDWRDSLSAYDAFANGDGYLSDLDKGVHDVVVALEDLQIDLDLLHEGV